MHVRFCKTRIVHELSNVFTEINRRIYPKLFHGVYHITMGLVAAGGLLFLNLHSLVLFFVGFNNNRYITSVELI